MEHEQMTPAAWAWVAAIGAGGFTVGYFLLRGFMMAALWIGVTP